MRIAALVAALSLSVVATATTAHAQETTTTTTTTTTTLSTLDTLWQQTLALSSRVERELNSNVLQLSPTSARSNQKWQQAALAFTDELIACAKQYDQLIATFDRELGTVEIDSTNRYRKAAVALHSAIAYTGQQLEHVRCAAQLLFEAQLAPTSDPLAAKFVSEIVALRRSLSSMCANWTLIYLEQALDNM